MFKKWEKEKGTFVEVGKLLEDSYRSNHAKIHLRNSRSNFEQCSGQTGFLFFQVKR